MRKKFENFNSVLVLMSDLPSWQRLSLLCTKTKNTASSEKNNYPFLPFSTQKSVGII